MIILFLLALIFISTKFLVNVSKDNLRLVLDVRIQDAFGSRFIFPATSPTINATRYTSRLKSLENYYIGEAIHRVYRRSSAEDKILLTQLLEREGCRLNGYIDINKAPGSIRFLINLRQKTLNRFNINATELIKGFTFTHKIHSLTFGNTKDQEAMVSLFGETNAMKFDKANEIPIQSNIDYCLYYFSLIPHMFSIRPTTKETYQYSIAYNCLNSSLATSEFQLAFTYSISHIGILYDKETRSIFQVLIEIVAIVGGVYVIISLLNKSLDIIV